MMNEERPILFDEDIRVLLFDYLDMHYPKVRTFEEKRIGHSRADVMMILPYAIVGIEIKSDADTYARLVTQTKDYDKYFDMNYIAIGSKHLKRVHEHIPEHWGILCVDQTEEEPVIKEVRAAKPTPKIKIQMQFCFMWKNELCELLRQNKLPAYIGKSRKFIIDRLVRRVKNTKLKAQMCDLLFERDYTLLDSKEQEKDI